MSKPVEVPLEIYRGLESIKANGTNMDDYNKVLVQAKKQGDQVLSEWLGNNMKIYVQIIYNGLAPDKPE